MITFETTLFLIKDWVILQLPKEASAELPTRSMTMVQGTINNTPFRAVLEPDGKWSHWFRVTDDLLESLNVHAGDTVQVTLESTKDWIRPEVPDDLKDALAASPQALALWDDITITAQWEWIRWIRSTNNPDTRKRRIEVALSKLNAGKRRPCCFNRTLCSEPYVTHNWMLLEPSSASA